MTTLPIFETAPAAHPQQAGPARSDDRSSSTLFLQILVAQLRAQNPLEPLKGTEFVTQLAQFNAVEQLIGIRAELQRMRQASQTSPEEMPKNRIQE